MVNHFEFSRGQLARLLIASWSVSAGAWAADPPAAVPVLAAAPEVASSPAVTPSQNVTINLINRLVERGVLTKADAEGLIKMAENDAAEARHQSAQSQEAAQQAAAALQAVRNAPPAGAPGLPSELPFDPVPPAADDSLRVTYIPEEVRAQLREEVTQDVMAQAVSENWSGPRTPPEWVMRFKLNGDIRVRYEGIYFPDSKIDSNGNLVSGNDNTGGFPNFNAINTGSPFDTSGTNLPPELNVDQDRQRLRLRLRLGAEISLGEGFSAGVRIATGENNSPVSTNQSFGLANQGQGGAFSKYAIWLDRGYLRYELGGLPTKNLAITVGRFENPFFSTDTIWDDDLGFDGVVVQGKYQVVNGVIPFLSAGAFPVFNTDYNFSSNQPAKFESTDKWLYGVQLGTDWKINKDFSAKVALAYYHFEDIEGRISEPFTPLSAQDAGNTDNTRPSFAQKGNSYMALRNIVPNTLNNFGTTNQYQYYGLATPFRNVALTARLDYNHFEPFRVSLLGEYIKNVAYDSANLERRAVNNRASSVSSLGAFDGGDTAWMISLRVGKPVLEKRWDWTAAIGYRYVESDAVVDGFCDSDFGGGGTNLQGYTLSGSMALSSRVSFGVRWLSADNISGSPYKNDIIQFDVNAKF
jgi:Putative porin